MYFGRVFVSHLQGDAGNGWQVEFQMGTEVCVLTSGTISLRGLVGC
jgi:hypothetical protein